MSNVGTVGVHHVDFAVPVSVGGERNFASIGRPIRGGVNTGVVGELSNVGTVGVHHVDFEISVSVGDESNPASIGRPRRVEVEFNGVVGETGGVGPVCVHHVESDVPVSVGDECNSASVGRPRGIVIIAGMVGELCDLDAVRVRRILLGDLGSIIFHHVDF